MDRFSNSVSIVTITNSAATTGEITLSAYAGGMIFIPAGSPLTTLTWWASNKSGGTFLPANDMDGVSIVQTVAHTNCYPLPYDLFGARAIKAVGNDSGDVAVSLKA